MHTESLIRMLNDIGAFFAHEDTPEEQAQGVLLHIKRYWDPRMRTRIIKHYQHGGAGLSGHVRAAIALLAQEQQRQNASAASAGSAQQDSQ